MLGLSPFRGEVKTEAIDGQTHLGLGNLGATVNGIHQLGDADKTLRYNLGYSTSRLETGQSREVRQLDQGATSSYSEQDRQQGRQHLGQGILDYSANTSKSYFHEELTLNLSDQHTERALTRQGLDIGQLARAQNYHLQSATHWSRPTSEGSHLDLEGQLYLDALPRLQFSSPTPGLAFSSQLAGYRLRFSTALSYSLQLGGRWGIGGRVNFLGHYGQLTAEELLPVSALYQVRGGGLQIDTSPSLTYQGSLTTFSCSFPLSWITEGYRYGTASTKQTSSLVRLYPGIALQLNHNFSAGLKIVLNTTCSLSSSFTWTSRPIIRQGERLISQGGGYELRPALSLAPWEWISLDLDGACQVNLLRTPYYQSRSTRWSFSPGLTLHAWRYWYLSLSHEAQWSDLPAGANHPCHLLEASLRYQGRRWTVKLSGENLLNAHSQVSSFYSALDESLQQIRLRPRALLLSLSWRY